LGGEVKGKKKLLRSGTKGKENLIRKSFSTSAKRGELSAFPSTSPGRKGRYALAVIDPGTRKGKRSHPRSLQANSKEKKGGKLAYLILP